MIKRTAVVCLAAAVILAAADDRAEDREAIRAHIDRIFKAFINKDSNDLKATHDANWLGFLEGSRKAIHGIDEYMRATGNFTPGSPYGMSGYRMREFDIAFQGDAAFVTFVAEVESKTPSGTGHSVLRIADFYAKRNGHWIQAGSDTEAHPETVANQMQQPRTLSDASRKQLLDAREAVWRAYFTNDRAALDKLLPEDLITIEPGGSEFGNRKAVLDGAEQFAHSGAKLIRLEFPKTEIQCYGYTAIIYTTYLYELEKDGKRATNSGRATEMFVSRNGQWVNPGWHMDAVK